MFRFLRTLHWKLSLILLGLLCLIGGLAIPLVTFMTARYQQEVDQNLNRPLAASLAAGLGAKNLLSQNPLILKKARAEIKRLMVINPDVDVYLLDSAGTVLVYSGDRNKIRRGRVSLAPLRLFLSDSAPLPVLGDDPRAPVGQKVFSAAPFPADKRSSPARNAGYVYVILGGEHYTSVADLLERSYILRSSLWVLIAILVFVSGVGLLLFRLLTRRLRHLTAAMETFRDQGYSGPESLLSAHLFPPWSSAVSPRDEIDRLGMVYLQMSERIRGHLQELALADTHRREMVSNVSHDLRTPLAALHGYLETLLMKEGQLTIEVQRDYLQIALRHSERLAKLVSELFDLARLDSREVQIHLEPFSLSELVQDVVQQHHLAAQQKSIRLEALLPNDLPFVYADIALIERVLDNLLENALRYTSEGGSVTVGLALQGDTIEVRIADTGSGIRQEHLSHIFERFYRVPSQPDKPGCAGLGLAIAKRILELHASEIQVESVPDEGTSFTFHLPVREAPDV